MDNNIFPDKKVFINDVCMIINKIVMHTGAARESVERKYNDQSMKSSRSFNFGEEALM